MRGRLRRRIGTVAALGMGALALPILLEARVAGSEQPAGRQFDSQLAVPRASTLRWISFRPRQAAEFGLDGRATLARLLHWLLRDRDGRSRYLRAFEHVVEGS